VNQRLLKTLKHRLNSLPNPRADRKRVQDRLRRMTTAECRRELAGLLVESTGVEPTTDAVNAFIAAGGLDEWLARDAERHNTSPDEAARGALSYVLVAPDNSDIERMTTEELRRELARLEDEEKADQASWREKALAGVVAAGARPEADTAIRPAEPSSDEGD